MRVLQCCDAVVLAAWQLAHGGCVLSQLTHWLTFNLWFIRNLTIGLQFVFIRLPQYLLGKNLSL